MTTQTKKNTWVRFVGNAANIKQGNKHGWRCFLLNSRDDLLAPEIPLLDLRLHGMATADNFIPGIKKSEVSMTDGVVAWIDIYGDVEITDEILYITLGQPK